MKIICTSSPEIIGELIHRRVVLTIGIFDGVHIGHRHVIHHAQELAKNISAECAVYTFWPYPSHVLGDSPKTMLCSLQRKYEMIESLGVQHTIEQRFYEQFATLPAEKFIHFLKQQIPQLSGICVGSDFCFGHQRIGNVKLLKKQCASDGIALKIIEAYHVQNERVSSTLIRNLIASGDILSANKLLN